MPITLTPERRADYENHYGGKLEADYFLEADRLRELEEGDRAGSLDFLTREFEANTSGPAVRDSDVRRMFSGMASTAGRQALSAQRNARQAFADQGITGGNLQTAALTGTELQRYGQLTEGRNQLKQFQWQENAAQKWRRQNASMGVASAMRSPRSAVGIDAIGDLLGWKAQKDADASAREMAREQSRSNRRSGLIGAGASVVGSLLGLI